MSCGWRGILWRGLALATVLAVVLAGTTRVEGTQHLISPGEDVRGLSKQIRPGDEVLLLPGRHDPAVFF